MLKIQKTEYSENDSRVDRREKQNVADIRVELLAIQRKIEYPFMRCPCQSTSVSREHDRLAKSIRSALSATEKLIIHYIDRETII